MGAYANKLTSGRNPQGETQVGAVKMAFGTGVFTTTGTATTVRCPLKKLYAVVITPTLASTTSAAAAANGQLTAGGLTHNSDGTLSPVTAGQINVNRIAGTDSALPFCVAFYGE
jgi:hypothetical protein